MKRKEGEEGEGKGEEERQRESGGKREIQIEVFFFYKYMYTIIPISKVLCMIVVYEPELIIMGWIRQKKESKIDMTDVCLPILGKKRVKTMR